MPFMMQSDFLDAAKIERDLRGSCSLGPILVVDRIGSTNTALLEGAREGKYLPGTALAAEEQTSGRGTKGREWCAVPRHSLTFSVLIENPIPARPGFISVGAALSVARAIEDLCAIETAIKWPNDIYVGNGKLAGILAEGFQSSLSHLAVIGIGVNVNRAPDLSDGATGRPALSIFEATEHPTDRTELLTRILIFLEETMALLGDARRIRVARGLRRRSLLVDRHVRLVRSGAVYEGRLVDHTDDLGLVLSTEQGRIVLPGEGTDLVDFC